MAGQQEAKNCQSSNVNSNSIPVPLLDVGRQNSKLETEILDVIASVCRSGQFVLGPACQNFEKEIAAYCGTKHAIGCGSGSDALLLALMSIGIQAGDEVILPSFTFFATASAVSRLGAQPVFVDIDPESFNIDPDLIEPAITENTKAIIPVHLFGRTADMKRIMTIASEHGLKVIEDAAQAIGATYRGRPVGSIGHLGCISFYPTKNLGAFGDSGIVVTSDDRLADKLAKLRSHGMSPRYYHQEIGINSRLDSIQAAVLSVKLQHLETWTKLRDENAHRYHRLFTATGLTDKIQLPTRVEGHVWNQYTLRIPNGMRNQLREALTNSGIGTEVYYPIPIHLQECFRYLNCGMGTLPKTESACAEVLSLPIFPELTNDEQERVVGEIGNFFVQHSAKSPHANAA